MKSSELQELARLCNIQLTYEDAAGKRRSASRDALTAVLRARIGDRDFEDALRERKEELSRRFVDPVTVVWGSNRPRIDLRVPAAQLGRPVEWELRLEGGETRRGRVELARTVTIGETLPLGYHVLRIADAETFIIAAPRRAFGPESRSWGIFAPLYSIRTARSWGAGDLGDLRAYGEWVNGLGGGVVATLPMLAIDTEGDPSPYSPLSRLYWNEMYLELERIPEFDPADRDDAAITALQSTDQVDYKAVMREKRRVLEKMLTRFRADAEFDRFANTAANYAEFRAETENRGSRTDDSSRYHLYAQYRMSQQMREVAADAKRSGPGLYLDFPLGVNPNGYDAKRYASSFANGVAVGAPPDLFFTRGQNWGFRPFDPDAIRAERYAYFRDCVRHHASHAGVLRMDHVMGLHRLFWIVEGAEAKEGVYVRYPEEEMYAILLVESNRHRCVLVGEDLGTVPQYVPAMMKKRGLRRMYVAQYEAKPESDQPVGSPPEESVASINTHDMPTFASFWHARDVDDRVEMALLDERGAREEREKRESLRAAVRSFLKARGLLHDGQDDTKQVLAGLLHFLGASDAEIVLMNLEDLWLETDPQNVPGMPGRSWRQKFKFTLEQMQRNTEVTAALHSMDEQRREVNGNAT